MEVQSGITGVLYWIGLGSLIVGGVSSFVILVFAGFWFRRARRAGVKITQVAEIRRQSRINGICLLGISFMILVFTVFLSRLPYPIQAFFSMLLVPAFLIWAVCDIETLLSKWRQAKVYNNWVGWWVNDEKIGYYHGPRIVEEGYPAFETLHWISGFRVITRFGDPHTTLLEARIELRATPKTPPADFDHLVNYVFGDFAHHQLKILAKDYEEGKLSQERIVTRYRELLGGVKFPELTYRVTGIKVHITDAQQKTHEIEISGEPGE